MKERPGLALTLPLFAWVSLFLVVPIAIVLVYSFLTKDPSGGGIVWAPSLDGYQGINLQLVKPIWTTVMVAVIATLLVILIALPCAYYLARSPNTTTLLLLIIIPFWVNFLIRVWAWMAVLGSEGFLNDLFHLTGLLPREHSIQFLHNIWAVIVVHVYTYLPFAILPLYSTMEKFDFQLLEAARDLGATHFGSIRRILLPNVQSGILTSVLFTFIPTLGSFAISDLVGGKEGYMIGNAIDYAIRTGNNWPRASALSVLLIVLTSLGLLVYFLANRSIREKTGGDEE